MNIKIVHLYPELMSIYGDLGNIICLQKRAFWRGIDCSVTNVNIGDKLPDEFDLLFMGGGQDTGQNLVAADLQSKASQIQSAIEDNLPALTICGGYQLFGKYFKTAGGDKIQGIGVFDLKTTASNERMIGNIVANSTQFGKLVGFENHSGQTILALNQNHLGSVSKGFGNNSTSRQEGAVYKNAIGTYMHGSFLPKNPHVADYLLLQALRRHDKSIVLHELDDSLAYEARKIAIARPR